MRQNSFRKGQGTGVPSRKIASVAALNSERKRNEALYADEVNAFYAAHPELFRSKR